MRSSPHHLAASTERLTRGPRRPHQTVALAAFWGVVTSTVSAAPSAWATAVDRSPSLAQFDQIDDAGADWQAYRSRGELHLDRRSVGGSSFYEYRAIVDVPLAPERAATEVWAALRGGDMESLKLRKLLRDGPDELILYDRIHTPIVSDRDYTIRVRRLHDPARRRTQFRCDTANHLGPPPQRGYVRIPVIHAGWITEPNRSGGTRLSYYAYSEPGGALAAFLTRGPQGDRALADVAHMLQRLRSAARRH